MSVVRGVGPDGRRRLSPEVRAKIAATSRANFAALPPEEQERRRANLRRGVGGAPPPDAPAPAAAEGPVNPLDDAPRADPVPGPALAGRPTVAARPLFEVPDIAPLGPAAPPVPEGGAPLRVLTDDELVAGVTVSEDQVRSLLEFPFEFVAIRRGAHWKLRPDEAAMIAGPLTRKVNEHAVASRAIAAGGDWAVIVGGLAIIVSARVMEDRERAERESARTGRVDAQGDRRDGRAADRPDARGPLRHLNGAPTGDGAPDDGRGAPLAAEAPRRPLVQAFGG